MIKFICALFLSTICAALVCASDSESRGEAPVLVEKLGRKPFHVAIVVDFLATIDANPTIASNTNLAPLYLLLLHVSDLDERESLSRAKSIIEIIGPQTPLNELRKGLDIVLQMEHCSRVPSHILNFYIIGPLKALLKASSHTGDKESHLCSSCRLAIKGHRYVAMMNDSMRIVCERCIYRFNNHKKYCVCNYIFNWAHDRKNGMLHCPHCLSIIDPKTGKLVDANCHDRRSTTTTTTTTTTISNTDAAIENQERDDTAEPPRPSKKQKRCDNSCELCFKSATTSYMVNGVQRELCIGCTKKGAVNGFCKGKNCNQPLFIDSPTEVYCRRCGYREYHLHQLDILVNPTIRY